MTSTTSVDHTPAARTLLLDGCAGGDDALLDVGAENKTAPPPPTRLDPGWEEHAAAFLAMHPEISAAVPRWTEELDFIDIESDVDGTIFSFARTIRDVEIYGGGRLHADGRVELCDNGIPNIYIRSELRADEDPNVAQWALHVAEDLTAAALLLRAESKLLRRPVDVDAELQRLDI
ncbi:MULTISPECIES: hypothetical protein [unclassified Microbacterium]|uniref:hypothetical protein n=1 Tax=unclassified Microbacterium TaxID=2609290 RepID=UPI000EA8F783|nr:MULTISPECIES: hypothetical protein [unclassified Microbacterium]MBT2484625.1 hypothetical protein [Microbacterium sp. ISL-108]RKN67517.1 hypothetical protein D7252_07950 [Microbacterium sp. CGR2]